ncbi:MAG: hypothetical protein IJD78_02500 [Clostridia bacterium]|nr:hypothetical protein [Clostridia bacterium]
MKKILAVLAAFATLFSLASCKMKNNQTTAERVSEVEAEYSMQIASSIQAETEREEKIIKSIEDIGKSEKKKQLVLKRAEDHYQVYVMNKKNICKKIVDYYFFDDIDAYYIKSNGSKSDKNRKKIIDDPEARMIAFERDFNAEKETTYDEIYEIFSDPRYADLGISIVE